MKKQSWTNTQINKTTSPNNRQQQKNKTKNKTKQKTKYFNITEEDEREKTQT